MEVIRRPVEEVLEVSAAFEVDQREPHRSVGDLTRHAHDVVAHPEASGVALHLRGDLRRQRNQQQLG